MLNPWEYQFNLPHEELTIPKLPQKPKVVSKDWTIEPTELYTHEAAEAVGRVSERGVGWLERKQQERIRGREDMGIAELLTTQFTFGLGKGVVRTPAAIMQLGMGAELIARRPVEAVRAIPTGLGIIGTAYATSFRERPAETAGELIGTALLAKGAGRGVQLAKAKVPYTIKLQPPKELLIRGIDVSLPKQPLASKLPSVRETLPARPQSTVFVEQIRPDAGRLYLRPSLKDIAKIQETYTVGKLKPITTPQGSFYVTEITGVRPTLRSPLIKGEVPSIKLSQFKPHFERKVKLSPAELKMGLETPTVKIPKYAESTIIDLPPKGAPQYKPQYKPVSRSTKGFVRGQPPRKTLYEPRKPLLLKGRTSTIDDLWTLTKEGKPLSTPQPKPTIITPHPRVSTVDVFKDVFKPRETVIHTESPSMFKPTTPPMTKVQPQVLDAVKPRVKVKTKVKPAIRPMEVMTPTTKTVISPKVEFAVVAKPKIKGAPDPVLDPVKRVTAVTGKAPKARQKVISIPLFRYGKAMHEEIVVPVPKITLLPTFKPIGQEKRQEKVAPLAQPTPIPTPKPTPQPHPQLQPTPAPKPIPKSTRITHTPLPLKPPPLVIPRLTVAKKKKPLLKKRLPSELEYWEIKNPVAALKDIFVSKHLKR